jgi:uncharacterized protein with ATP-grasp and redox domains
VQIQPECVPCLLKRCLYETNLVDESLGPEVMTKAMEVLSKEYKFPAVSAEVATDVHRVVYDILGTDDPYKRIKERSNRVALELFPRAEEFVESSDDRLKAAVICSIAGNVLDFGIGSSMEAPEELIQRFNSILEEGLGRDDTGEMKRILEKGGDVFLFGDNCGEIIFDKVLIKELEGFDIHLTYVAKGEPILTDATIEDVREFGIDKMVDGVATTNAFAVGVPMDKLDSELLKKVENATLLIAKGMANWESFSEHDHRPIAYLLRTKCKPVADSIGEEQDINAAKLFA